MTYLFDGTNHPSAQQVIAAGAAGCLMYGGTPNSPKNFTAAQYADYKAHGLLTLFIFENLATDISTGATGGAAHAQALLADLISKSVDLVEPVGVTADEHLTGSMISTAVTYQRGFYQAVKSSVWKGPAGGYGFAEFLTAIHDAGVADWYWGAGTRSLLPPYTNVWQDNTGTILVGGAQDDRDWILVPLPTGGAMTGPVDVNLAESIGNNTTGQPVSLQTAIDMLYALVGDSAAPTNGGKGTIYERLDHIDAALAANDVQISTLITNLGAGQASILTAEQTTDADVKTVNTQLTAAIQAEGTPQVTETELQTGLAALNIGPATASALVALLAKAAGTTP